MLANGLHIRRQIPELHMQITSRQMRWAKIYRETPNAYDQCAKTENQIDPNKIESQDMREKERDKEEEEEEKVSVDVMRLRVLVRIDPIGFDEE